MFIMPSLNEQNENWHHLRLRISYFICLVTTTKKANHIAAKVGIAKYRVIVDERQFQSKLYYNWYSTFWTETAYGHQCSD